MNETMIKINNLSKEYKMFANKKDRLVEAMFPTKIKKSVPHRHVLHAYKGRTYISAVPP